MKRQKKHRKQRQGEVVSAAADKTIVVKVKRRVRHPLYKKVVTRFKKFYAHDEDNKAKAGIRCAFRNAPKIKLKRWELLEVVGG